MPRQPDVWVYGDVEPIPASLTQANFWYIAGNIRVETNTRGEKHWVLTPKGLRVIAQGRAVAENRGLTLPDVPED